MNAELKKTYFVFTIPAILGFMLAYGARAFNIFRPDRVDAIEILAPLVFILSIVLATALPVSFRTLFAYRKRDRKKVTEAEMLKFERLIISITLITPYLALTAYVFEFPGFYTHGSILMGLYALYYFFPSKKRLALDRRIFRVK